MAIDTYAKLQSEILDTLDRTDLVADVTEFTPGTIEGAVQRAISKAERRIIRRLRTREFETSSSISTVSGTETISIPSDLVMIKAAVIQTNPNVVLQQKDLTTLLNDNPSTATGTPASYAAFGTSLYLRPVPGTAQTIKLFYYNSPTPLSDSNTSNTILTKYPDLLLYGALIEITAHVEDDERLQIWKGAFDEAVKDITEDNTLNRWSGAPIRSSIDIRNIV
jgi:hypothetical protein